MKAVLDLEQDILTTNIDRKKEFGCVQTPGGHLVIQLFVEDDWTTDETVFLMNEEIDYAENVKRIHEVTNHKSEANMLHAYRNAGRLTDEIRKKIKNVVETCKVCQQFKRSQGRPKVALPKVTDFNQVVSLDLKQFDEINVLWMIAPRDTPSWAKKHNLCSFDGLRIYACSVCLDVAF